MPPLTADQWLLAILGALGIGVAKSGFAGVSMLHVLVFAFLFGARESTGVVLPMLIAGDILAVCAFRQHARWEYIRRMLPPALLGVVAGWLLMHRLSGAAYKPLIGGIILSLTVLQLWRHARPALFERVPRSAWFAWAMGLLAGGTTMLINMGRARYVWATVVPLSFVTVTTMTAGYLSVRDNFWPLTQDPATAVTGYVDSIATVVMMSCMVLILAQSVRRCLLVLNGKAPVVADAGPVSA